MRKLLLCLVIGLSAAMLFAVDITQDLNSKTSWETPAGNEFKVNLTIDPDALNYIRVGFSGTEITNDTTGIISDKANVTLAAGTDESTFNNASDDVYVYYQVRTADKIQISLAAEDMSTIANDHTIPFNISFTPKGTTGGATSIDSAATMATLAEQATPVLAFTPTEDNVAEAKAESVALTISTTIDKIPVGATGDYSGKIKMFVTIPE